jgi:hypothetical protein
LLICRCAWHRRYFGYPLLSGVVSWRGLSLRFTDGICPRCLDRFRSEHRRFLNRREEMATQPKTVALSHEGAA